MIKVLIVEDDPMVAKINSSFLKKMGGFQLVAVAPNVDQAISIIQEQCIDLILLDIYMPKEPGWHLLSQIRDLSQEIDVIIISAANDIESIKKGLRFGVVDYLIKPFEFERFQTALNKYKEEFTLLNNKEIINQVDLDNIIFHKDQELMLYLELPKGLTRDTLKKVWKVIEGMDGANFSTDKIANLVGISRVSARKYLCFLREIKAIDTQILYGAVGRPVYLYRMKDEENVIQSYINV